jgi:phosphoglycolate phosphatase-like HAD superfamily hydrolase
VKIRYIYEHILKQGLTNERFEALVQEYGRLVLGGVLVAPFVPGALGCLENLDSRIPLFIASGTPDQELHVILEKRNLRRYFTAVYGASMTKTDALRDISRRYRIPPAEMLFVGDAPSDRDAAIDADIPFVGRIRPNDRDRLSGTSGVGFVIRDLNELCAYLEKKMD